MTLILEHLVGANKGAISSLNGVESSVACAADPCVQSIAAGVSPLYTGARFIGPAKTVRVGLGQNGAIHRAVHTAQAGDIIVVEANGDVSHGYFGDLLTTCCMMRGIAGLVIDGSVRDVEAIRELQFPVYCIAANPGQTQKREPGEIDVPITCGGARISPGDVIIADADGVAVVSSNAIESVADAAKQVLVRESDIRKRLNAGETTYEVFDLKVDHE